MKSNRDLIVEELGGVLSRLATQSEVIEEADAELRGMREAREEILVQARNLRLAVFALDGETGRTVEDADEANMAALAKAGGV